MNKPAQLELVGRKIRQLRRQRKFTQVELAARIGVHQSDLSRMEQGEYKVGLDTLLKILATFDLSIGDFFDEGPRSETVLQKYRSLSLSAQKEVESFIEFKQSQEGELPWETLGGDSAREERPVAAPAVQREHSQLQTPPATESVLSEEFSEKPSPAGETLAAPATGISTRFSQIDTQDTLVGTAPEVIVSPGEGDRSSTGFKQTSDV